jgi:hypothetical protein
MAQSVPLGSFLLTGRNPGFALSTQTFRNELSESRTMNTPDQDIALTAIEDARRILREYDVSGPRDATRTVHRLIAVLDRDELVHALDRLKRRRTLRLV